MDISSHRGPTGEHGRGLIYQRLCETDEGCSRNGTLLSEWAQCGRPLGRTPLLETLEDILRKALDTDISFHRGPIGEPGGDSFLGLLREKDSTSEFLSWIQRILRF